MSAEDIIDLTGMTEAYAYKLIKQLNKELQDRDYLTILGRVSKDYLIERLYGIKVPEYDSLQR